MFKYLIKRILTGILIVFCGAFIVYAVIRCLPTSYVETVARQRASAPTSTKTYQEWLTQLQSVYGLDVGTIKGYFIWIANVIKGDFGDSWLYGIPVIQKFKDVIGYSIVLNIISLVVEVVISIPLGILAARKQYSKTDYAVTIFALLGISLPSFFTATLLKFAFSVKLGWFDTAGIVGRNYNNLDAFGKFLDMGNHLVLPIITLILVSIGGLMRYTRTNMLEVLNADYIRTARAKGLSERKVINSHAFRNTLIPLVTYMSYLLPTMFGGSMIIEQIFQIPGIGYTSYQATLQGDIPFAMFYLTFMLILTQVSLIVADLMYAAVDPRVRLS
jgi:peptide/nickel transport system permease protein